MTEFPYPEPSHPDIGPAVYVLHAALLFTAGFSQFWVDWIANWM